VRRRPGVSILYIARTELDSLAHPVASPAKNSHRSSTPRL